MSKRQRRNDGDDHQNVNKSQRLKDSVSASSSSSSSSSSSLGTSVFAVSSEPSQVVGRAKQRDRIVEFLSASQEHRQNNALYIYGSPGTGKSLLVRKIAEELGQREPGARHFVSVNCMGVERCWSIFDIVLRQLNASQSFGSSCSSSSSKKKDGADALRRWIRDCERSVVVVLDEVDALHVGGGDQVLYEWFDMSLGAARLPQLRLVCISNELDLTARLRRLEQRNTLPLSLQFQPYSADELSEIVGERIKRLAAAGVFDARAIRLATSRVANESGDARKVLDLCAQALERVTGGTVGLRDMIAVWNESTRCANDNAQRIDDLPLHCQLLVCATFSATSSSSKSSRRVTMSDIQSAYKSMCRRNALSPTTFHSLWDRLVAVGLVSSKRSTQRGQQDLPSISIALQDLQQSQAMSTNPILKRIVSSFNHQRDSEPA
jgi:archaeal cell division control protein 6